jgi:DNA (cytosine-5)-methyltransferase 1
MEVLEVCAGAGGAAVGLSRAGYTHTACVESAADACATLRSAGFPVLEVDLRTYHPPFMGGGLLWASPPCQPFSTAGKRRARHDPRNLWPGVVRCIDEAQPRWFVMENVRGLTYHKKGCTPLFPVRGCAGCYLEGTILAELRSRYAHVWHGVLDAADYGVPQHRRRLIIVAGPVPFTPPVPTHGPSTDTPWVSCGEALGITGTIDGGRNSASNPRQERVVGSGEPCPSIGTRGNQVVRTPTGKRCLQPGECAILQGMGEHPFIGANKRSLYRQIGNAVPPPLAEAIGRAVLSL